MSTAGLTPEDIKANIRQARARKDAALAEYEAAKAELAWWAQGLRLFDPKAADSLEAEHDSGALVTELFPDGSVFESGTKPTLRQAIVLVMRENPQVPHWTPPALTAALAQCGWLPMREAPRDATKRVSDMAGIMYNSGQLSRLARGVYRLSPPLAAALDTGAANDF